MIYGSATPLTLNEIDGRLKALDMYNQNVMFTMPDEGDLTTREMTRIMIARSALQSMKAAIKAIPDE